MSIVLNQQAIADYMLAGAIYAHNANISHHCIWHETCEGTGHIKMVTIKETPDVADKVQKTWGRLMTEVGLPTGKRADCLIAVYGTGLCPSES